MLYGYPITATAENWLHECLCEIVRTIHARLDAGQEVDGWPDIIPGAYRARISAYTSLRDSLTAYSTAAAKISAKSRGKILACLNAQNQISDLLSCAGECDAISALPKAVQKKIVSLFTCAFKMLTGLGIRDRHYRAIYDAEESHVCPFCGCEYFDAPGAPREDLDHYLAKSIYPFAAANLQNLVPMGVKCNEKYKLSQDILRDSAGTRRRSFFPYNHGEISVSLNNSQPFSGAEGQNPLWQIDFVPDSQECATWNMVFKVRERYIRDVLDPLLSHSLNRK